MMLKICNISCHSSCSLNFPAYRPSAVGDGISGLTVENLYACFAIDASARNGARQAAVKNRGTSLLAAPTPSLLPPLISSQGEGCRRRRRRRRRSNVKSINNETHHVGGVGGSIMRS
ncbi:uncharacterized protein UTRI_05657 [Ustilago trichophora]|uniref:Uncharacterized protein n=1 Tax=Ustilago trichophora TaxID=86804 RepID=A0A5C3EEL5_9BASI|nr:uncharacterized protein UTRI_05657 [Ustilago trichophora]